MSTQEDGGRDSSTTTTAIATGYDHLAAYNKDALELAALVSRQGFVDAIRELADELRYADEVYPEKIERGYRQAEDEIKRRLLAILGGTGERREDETYD
jgi:hypothetical protein